MPLVASRFVRVVAASALALVLVAAGCGGGGGGFDLEDCGNGRLDDGETCDDGNLLDTDACLSTCEPAACGDGFLQTGVETCEIGVVPSTCQAQGFTSGTLACGGDCRFDTSGCRGAGGPTPGPSATPAATDGATSTSGGPTPTDGGGPATPSAQPTPAGDVCDGNESIVLVASLDADVTSARLDVAYPPGVNLPGTGTDTAVKDRVDFTGSGLTVVNDFDQDGDLADDTLTASLVGTDLVAAGPFVAITFDCVAGAAVPTAASFTCDVVSASNAGTSVAATCALALR